MLNSLCTLCYSSSLMFPGEAVVVLPSSHCWPGTHLLLLWLVPWELDRSQKNGVTSEFHRQLHCGTNKFFLFPFLTNFLFRIIRRHRIEQSYYSKNDGSLRWSLSSSSTKWTFHFINIYIYIYSIWRQTFLLLLEIIKGFVVPCSCFYSLYVPLADRKLRGSLPLHIDLLSYNCSHPNANLTANPNIFTVSPSNQCAWHCETLPHRKA